MKSYGYIENEFGYIEDEMMILLELNLKDDFISIGSFLGDLISNYELKDIRKVKSIIKKLYIDEVSLINIVDSDSQTQIENVDDIEFTRELIKLNDLGKLVLSKNLNMSLFNTRIYETSDKVYKNISLDKLILLNFLEDMCSLEDICFSKESGFYYLNESDVLIELFNEGFSILEYKKSFNYFKYLNKLKIIEGYKTESCLTVSSDFENHIFNETVNINYLYFINSELKLISLAELLLNLKSSYNNLTSDEKLLYKESILNNYNIVPYESNKNLNDYYLYYNKETKCLELLTEFVSDGICFDINLNKYDYYIVSDSLHIKIDLNNIHLHSNVLGLFRIEKEILSEKYIYFLNEDGEIKSTSNTELQMRNKQIRSLSTDKRLLKVYEVLECENGRYGVLLITEKGYIKILNLLEYKIKNRCSKYVMGINLDADDKVIYSNLVNLDTDIITINIDNNYLDFNINTLISSKVNKGKKIKTENERIKIIKMESE